MTITRPFAFIIFGATGDLTHRKLLPALYFLEHEGALPDNYRIIGAARREKSSRQFQSEIKKAIKKYSRIKVKESCLKKLLERVTYHRLEFHNTKNYYALKQYIAQEIPHCDRLFYLATAPQYFDIIVKKLYAAKLARKSQKRHFSRVAFEKPFGKDLRSAKKLNRAINKVFSEKQIYRIDHYLAKELVQNMMVMRFGNAIFEPLWNARFIDHVQITLAETLGVDNRGAYYDKNGSLRDVVQNHVMQLLCLTAMDAPKSLTADHIKNAKVRVLKSIKTPRSVLKSSVKGQYLAGAINKKPVKAYHSIEGVGSGSTTSTFFAIKFNIKNAKWKRVPFYIRSGKRLAERATEIVIMYKEKAKSLLEKMGYKLECNQLVIRVQPDEGIIFKFNTKIPGNKLLVDQVSMDFCHECKFGPDTAEAYEKLIHDILVGDQTLFTRWDEVEYSWKIIDQYRDAWHGRKPRFYKPGTWGPQEADRLLENDGRAWIKPQKPLYAKS